MSAWPFPSQPPPSRRGPQRPRPRQHRIRETLICDYQRDVGRYPLKRIARIAGLTPISSYLHSQQPGRRGPCRAAGGIFVFELKDLAKKASRCRAARDEYQRDRLAAMTGGIASEFFRSLRKGKAFPLTLRAEPSVQFTDPEINEDGTLILDLRTAKISPRSIGRHLKSAEDISIHR